MNLELLIELGEEIIVFFYSSDPQKLMENRECEEGQLPEQECKSHVRPQVIITDIGLLVNYI